MPLRVKLEDESGVPANIVQIAAGEDFAAALDDQGSVWVWGGMSFFDEALWFPEPERFPIPGKRIESIAAGATFLTALTDDGRVYVLGEMMGDGPGSVIGGDPENIVLTATAWTPVQVGGGGELTGIGQIAAGYNFALALDGTGKVYAWGGNGHGQLGTGYSDGTAYAVEIPGLPFVEGVHAGPLGKSAFATVTGAVYGWGMNLHGNLGAGGTEPYPSPVPVPIPDLEGTSVRQISTSYDHTILLLDNGTVLGAGNNELSAMGADASIGDQTDEFKVLSLLEGATRVFAGYQATFFSDAEGKAWAVGRNVFDGPYSDYKGALGTRSWYSSQIDEPQPMMELAGEEPIAAPFRVTTLSGAVPSHKISIELQFQPAEGWVLAAKGSLDEDGTVTLYTSYPGPYMAFVFLTDDDAQYRILEQYLLLVGSETFEVMVPEQPEYAVNLNFSPDSDAGPGRIKGWLHWEPALPDFAQDIEQYLFYWIGKDGQRMPPPYDEPELSEDKNGYNEYLIPIGAWVPNGAAGLALFAKAGSAEIDTGTRLMAGRLIMDPESVFLTDADPDPGSVQLSITWSGLADESGIRSYVLYEYGGYYGSKVAEIRADGRGTYTYEFPPDMDLFFPMLSVRYDWGGEVPFGPLLYSVDNIGNLEAPDGDPDPNLEPPEFVSFMDSDPDEGEIGGWIRWEKNSSLDPYDVTGYEIAFLDGDRNYLRSLMRVTAPLPYDWFHTEELMAYIPENTPVPEGAVYLGVFSRYDDYDESYIGVQAGTVGLTDYQAPPVEQPTDINRIRGTGIGVLTEQEITHIPKSAGLSALLEQLDLHPRAQILEILYDGQPIEQPDFWPVRDYMELHILDPDARAYRVYTLRTLSSLLDGQNPDGPDGRVDLTDILPYMSLETPQDLTGDGKFDGEDARRLLEEIDPVVDDSGY